MQVTRRQFITYLSAISALGAVPSLALAAISPQGRRLVLGTGTSLHIVDYEKQQLSHSVNVGFSPHGIIPSPVNKNIVWAIQRNGIRKPDGSISDDFYTAEVDLSSGKVMRKIKAPTGSDFRGHAFFAPGSNILFIARMDFNDGYSYLTGYDTDTLKKVEDYRLCKGGCHETKVGADGKVYAAVWGMSQPMRFAKWGHIKHERVYTDGKKEPSRIIQMDINSGKPVNSTAIEDENRMLTHFEVLKDGTILAVSVSLAFKDYEFSEKVPAGIFYGKAGGDYLTPVTYTLDVENGGGPSETFGIAVDEAEGFAAIGDYTNKVLINVGLASGKYMGQKPFAVKDIMYDRVSEKFIVAEQGLTRLNADMQPVDDESGFSLIKGPYTEGHMIIV